MDTGIDETLNLSMGTSLEGSIDGLRDESSEGRREPTPVIGPSRAEGRRLAIVSDDEDEYFSVVRRASQAGRLKRWMMLRREVMKGSSSRVIWLISRVDQRSLFSRRTRSLGACTWLSAAYRRGKTEVQMT